MKKFPYLLHNSFPVQDEHTPETDAFLLDQNTIVSSNTVICIAQQGDVNLSKSPILSGDILPVPQRVLGIDRDEHDAAMAIFELVEAVLKSENLSGADEAKGRRDKHEYKPSGIWVWLFTLDGRTDVRVDVDFCATLSIFFSEIIQWGK